MSDIGNGQVKSAIIELPYRLLWDFDAARRPDPALLTFRLAAVLGFLIGLERELRDETIPTVGIRDFVLFSLVGAVVSGLTDADAIAFSVTSLQASGLIHIDWAAFYLILGAISNTFMKLFLVLGLGDRVLFKKLLGPFLIIGIVGLVSTLLYYDLGTALQAAGG